MNKLAASMLALGCLFTPSLVAAQTVVYAPWTQPVYLLPQSPDPEPVTRADDAPRFRFGIAGNLSTAMARNIPRGVDATSFGPGLALDLGVQVSAQLAVYAHASASSFIMVNQASVFGVVEYSPTDAISFGTGIGWSGIARMFASEVNAGCCASDAVWTRGTWEGVAIPAIVGINIARGASPTGRRRATRLGIEGSVGVDPASGVVGWQAGVSIGYVAM